MVMEPGGSQDLQSERTNWIESWLQSGGPQIQASRNLCFTLSLAAGEAESLSREECSLVWRDGLLTGCGPHTSEGSSVLCRLQS